MQKSQLLRQQALDNRHKCPWNPNLIRKRYRSRTWQELPHFSATLPARVLGNAQNSKRLNRQNGFISSAWKSPPDHTHKMWMYDLQPEQGHGRHTYVVKCTWKTKLLLSMPDWSHIECWNRGHHRMRILLINCFTAIYQITIWYADLTWNNFW